MNLVLIIQTLDAGGAERVISELANYWASHGHKVSLITFAGQETKPFYRLDPGVALINLGKNNKNILYFGRFIKIFKSFFRLRKMIRVLKPDIMVSFIDLMNIMVLIACFGFQIPVVISERVDPRFHQIPLLFRLLRLLVYPFSTRLVVQTKRIAEYFPKYYMKFIKIIPNPVLLPKNRKENVSKNAIKFVSVGRLALQKDHSTLIQAFSKIVDQYPEVTLTIYGEGPERERLEHLIAHLNLDGKVKLPGVVDEMHKILREADLFIFPSRFEALPNALCEAMAVGLPVIASNCSGNIDIIRDKVDGRLFLCW